MNKNFTAIEFLAELIKIPSVNPNGNPGIMATGEADMAYFLEKYLTEIGGKTHLVEVLPGRYNIICCFCASSPNKKKLLLAPHLDTVSVARMSIDPFSGMIHEGRIWGRGATDTKGSIAAMCIALMKCQDILPFLEYEIWFAGLVGEEDGQQGAKMLAKEHFDFVIVGEPTNLQAVISHKGILNIRLLTKGVAGHASNPQKAKNAIEIMMNSLSLIYDKYRLLESKNRSIKHKLPQYWKDSSITLNIGTITGGTQSNVVPDFCEARLDIRYPPTQSVENLLQEFESAAPEAEFIYKYTAPLVTDVKNVLLEKLVNLSIPLTSSSWCSDASIFSEQGIPSIALGPGNIHDAHTANESISISDLEKGVLLFKKILHSLHR